MNILTESELSERSPLGWEHFSHQLKLTIPQWLDHIGNTHWVRINTIRGLNTHGDSLEGIIMPDKECVGPGCRLCRKKR